MDARDDLKQAWQHYRRASANLVAEPTAAEIEAAGANYDRCIMKAARAQEDLDQAISDLADLKFRHEQHMDALAAEQAAWEQLCAAQDYAETL